MRYLSTTIKKKEHKVFGCSSSKEINDKKEKRHIPCHWTCKIMKVQNKNKRNNKIKFVTTIKSDHHHFHFLHIFFFTHPPRTLITTYEWARERDRVNILQDVVEESLSHHEFEFCKQFKYFPKCWRNKNELFCHFLSRVDAIKRASFCFSFHSQVFAMGNGSFKFCHVSAPFLSLSLCLLIALCKKQCFIFTVLPT